MPTGRDRARESFKEWVGRLREGIRQGEIGDYPVDTDSLLFESALAVLHKSALDVRVCDDDAVYFSWRLIMLRENAVEAAQTTALFAAPAAEARQFAKDLRKHTALLGETLTRGQRRPGLRKALALTKADEAGGASADKSVAETTQSFFKILRSLSPRLKAVTLYLEYLDAVGGLRLSGAGRKTDRVERYVLHELGEVYKEITGRRAATSKDNYAKRPQDRVKGVFVTLVRAFYQEMLPEFAAPSGPAIKARLETLHSKRRGAIGPKLPPSRGN